MEFAKIFSFEDGQLLVEKQGGRALSHPHEVAVKVKLESSKQGIQVTHSYISSDKRDAHFDSYTEERAKEAFDQLQKALDEGYLTRSEYSW